MRRTKHRAVRITVQLLAASLLLSACTESSGPDDNSGSGVENLPVLMGNFHINTAPVTTNEDGKSKNDIDDYVLPSQLPNVNFEVFTTHLYAPVSSDVSTTVSNVRVFVGRTDGSRTGDIYQSGQFVQRATVNGQEYSVYQLNGFYNVSPTLTKANFANVSFEMNVRYNDAAGNTLTTRAVTLSVYKRQ